MDRLKQSDINVAFLTGTSEAILTPLLKVRSLLKAVLVLMVAAVLLTGCSSAPSYSVPAQKSVPLSSSVDLTDSQGVKHRLLSQYRDWKGAPYRYGGTTRSGVDCSAFVQNTFYSQLGYQLPRTTETQIKSGTRVAKNQLRVGDIVFFKTSSKSLHNGIYIGGSQFIHASSSVGVTISNLENKYWQKTYLTSVRVR